MAAKHVDKESRLAHANYCPCPFMLKAKLDQSMYCEQVTNSCTS